MWPTCLAEFEIETSHWWHLFDAWHSEEEEEEEEEILFCLTNKDNKTVNN